MLGVSPTAEEADLHHRLRIRRDKVVAHTDIAQMRLSLSTWKAIDDSDVMIPCIDFDDALAFFADRWTLTAWLHKLIGAATDVIFDRVQGRPPIRFIRDRTLLSDGA